MPWSTPPLSQVRSLVRDAIHGALPGSDATIPNSVLRVMGDAQGALCFLTLEYLDWLALQLMPDTAETEWLDRFGNIWLTNADGTTGRKKMTLAAGTIAATGIPGTPIAQYSQLGVGSGISGTYQTTEQATLGAGPTQIAAQATFAAAGSIGNLDPGTAMQFLAPPLGVDGAATVIQMTGGTDTETDDELRARVLERIRQPPMGGDMDDYVQWALAVPGVTRAWCYPQEMGIGTVTVRFMMDDLRAGNGGFPLPQDVDAVAAYISIQRPVTVKDFWVLAPIPFNIDLHITNLDSDVEATRGAITASLLNEFRARSKPGETWFKAWSDEGIMAAPGVNSYALPGTDIAMPSPGYMPTLGDITYG
jgi:uncharacterized phage protein gp47/JayE